MSPIARYRQAKEWLESKDAKLLASDFPLDEMVIIKHGDGSEYKLTHAILLCEPTGRDPMFQEFLFVLTEHNGCFVFFKDDLEEYKVVKRS